MKKNNKMFCYWVNSCGKYTCCHNCLSKNCIYRCTDNLSSCKYKCEIDRSEKSRSQEISRHDVDFNIVDNKECHSSNKSASVNEEAKRLSLLLLNLHRQVDSKFKTNNIDTWAADIEKINRLDKRSYEDIEKVIRWVKTPGNFWFANIMSGKKLRLQFDRLIIEITSNRNYKKQKPKPFTD